jgi:hypothetical protein
LINRMGDIMPRFILRTVGLSFVLGIIGLVVGILTRLVFQPSYFVEWQSMGHPEGEILTDLVWADGDTVYAQNQSGFVFACCWYIATAPPMENNPYYTVRELPSIRGIPSDEFVDGIEVIHEYGEAPLTEKYALLKDGSVWKWQYAEHALSVINDYVTYAIRGALIGVIAGIAFSIGIHLRNNNGEAEASSETQDGQLD